MQLVELQAVLLDEIRPRARKLAARHPQFVDRVIRGLVQRAHNRFAETFFENDSDCEDFIAGMALDFEEQSGSGVGSIWIILLIQVLLPALIRAFLRWWNQSQSHRADLIELRDRLAAATRCDRAQ